MKILVVSLDELYGKALAIELCENGYDARFSKIVEGGYSVFVIDVDTVDASKIIHGKVTFSCRENEGQLIRPFLTEDLITAVKKEIETGNFADSGRYEHIEFTEKERQLLNLLLDNKGKTVTVEEISRQIWGKESASSNIVNVYIRYLREKIEGNGNKRIIFTVRGKGYRID